MEIPILKFTKTKTLQAKDYAERIRNAHSNMETIPPIREEIGIDNIELAYQIQNINTQFRLDSGARITGKKIGLTSFAVQKQLGVDQPDFGVLFHDMEILNGQSISVSKLMQPKIEAEIAFVLAEDLDRENLTAIDILSAIDYALPAIEIVGSRIENWNIKITDTIADNASASHYVLGHTPKLIDSFDMVNSPVKLFINDEIASKGTGAACMGSPINAVLWLANKMVEMGAPLQAGEVIFSGAVGPMVVVNEGDHVHAQFEGLGDVSVSFTK